MSKTVSKFATVHMKTSGVVMVRLPKAILDDKDLNLKHGERMRVSITNNNNVITLKRMGRGRKQFD